MKKPLVALLVVSCLPFLPLLSADFVNWDDPHNLSANPDMLNPTWETVGSYWKRPYKDLYVPVTYTVWSAVAAVAREGNGLNPTTFHLLNILLHLGSAAAVFGLLERLTGKGWAACLGALVFAVHPMQVEAVGWISGMKDVLAGMLGLWSIYVLILGLDRRRWGLFGVATLLFGLAMLSKPSAVVTPLLAFVLVVFFRPEMMRKGAAMLLFWLVMCIPIILVARRVQGAAGLEFIPQWGARPVVAADALAFYIRQLFFPMQLAIDYGRSPQWLMQSPARFFTWILPAGLLAIAVAVRRRAPLVLGSMLLFTAALLPVLGLTPFDFQAYSTVADHYAYLAMLGPAVLCAGLLAKAPANGAMRVGVAIVVLLGLRSAVQAMTWADSAALFGHTLDVNPTSLAGNVNLGRLHADEADAAMAAARKSTGQAQLAAVGAAEKESNQAIALFEAALAAHPHDVAAWKDLGNMFKLQGRWEQAQGAYEHALANAHGIDPGQAAELHTSLGTVLANQKKYEQAIGEFERALEADPSNTAARALLAQAEAMRRRH